MPKFWSVRGSTQADPATPVEPIEQHEPVEIYTVAALVTGKVSPQGRRLSDMLNTSSLLPVKDASVISYHDGLTAQPGPADSWQSVDTDDILFVMPPEHLSARQLRLHRRQRRVRVMTGDFELVGTAHTAPGSDVHLYSLRQRSRYLALTNAVAYSNTDPAWERAASVILVNLRPVVELKEMFTIA